MRNITKITYNTNNTDLASASTGYIAVLIYGSTHTILCKIPVDGRTFNKAPSNINMSEMSIQALKKKSGED